MLDAFVTKIHYNEFLNSKFDKVNKQLADLEKIIKKPDKKDRYLTEVNLNLIVINLKSNYLIIILLE